MLWHTWLSENRDYRDPITTTVINNMKRIKLVSSKNRTSSSSYTYKCHDSSFPMKNQGICKIVNGHCTRGSDDKREVIRAGRLPAAHTYL